MALKKPEQKKRERLKRKIHSNDALKKIHQVNKENDCLVRHFWYSEN